MSEKQKEQFVGIDKALKDNLVMRIYSNVGLREVKITNPNDNNSVKVYSNHDTLSKALKLASEHYLNKTYISEDDYTAMRISERRVGSFDPKGFLDNWLFCSCGFEIYAEFDKQLGKIRISLPEPFNEKVKISLEAPTFGEAYHILNNYGFNNYAEILVKFKPKE